MDNNAKLCAIVTWLILPAGLIWFFADEKLRKDSFAAFYVKQALVLFIAQLIIYFLGVFLPFIGWFLILPFGMIFIIVLWLMGLINILNGKEKELPFIGKYAKIFTF